MTDLMPAAIGIDPGRPSVRTSGDDGKVTNGKAPSAKRASGRAEDGAAPEEGAFASYVAAAMAQVLATPTPPATPTTGAPGLDAELSTIPGPTGVQAAAAAPADVVPAGTPVLDLTAAGVAGPVADLTTGATDDAPVVGAPTAAAVDAAQAGTTVEPAGAPQPPAPTGTGPAAADGAVVEGTQPAPTGTTAGPETASTGAAPDAGTDAAASADGDPAGDPSQDRSPAPPASTVDARIDVTRPATDVHPSAVGGAMATTATSATTAVPADAVVTAPPAPVAEQLVTAVTPLAEADGETRIGLALKPSELGAVEVEVRIVNGVVHLGVRTEHGQTADLLRQAANELRSSLAEAGLDAGSFTVSDERLGHDRSADRRVPSEVAGPAASRGDASEPAPVVPIPQHAVDPDAALDVLL